MRRLIKDPFYKDLGWIDLDVVQINRDRRSNDLHSELSESDLNFDEDQYIKDYAYKIGAVKPVLKNNKAELWYYADLAVIRYLKKYGSVWEWGFMDELEYISNYDELVELETEEDLQAKAERLQDDINNNLWRFNGRFLGESFGGACLIELNDGLIKYWISGDLEVKLSPTYEANESQIEILETIKKELL